MQAGSRAKATHQPDLQVPAGHGGQEQGRPEHDANGKQTAVASSIGVDPVLLGIVLVVALAVGGVFFVKRATDPKFVRIFAAIASVCGGIALSSLRC